MVFIFVNCRRRGIDPKFWFALTIFNGFAQNMGGIDSGREDFVFIFLIIAAVNRFPCEVDEDVGTFEVGSPVV